MKSFLTLCIPMFLSIAFATAQSNSTDFDPPLVLQHTTGVTYYQVERSNWSKYVNGKYIGLTHRETRANVSCTGSTNKGIKFSGFFYVLEETLKDMTKSAQSIDATIGVDFIMTPSGHMIFSRDEGMPQLRDFPSFPDTPLRIGTRWQGEGFRSVDPKNNGKRTLLPILAEYTLAGSETYHGTDVYRIKAKYAIRLNKFLKTKNDDETLESATGTHDADILVEKENGSVVLIIDRCDETFFYNDGTSVRLKGNTALFTEYPVLMDRSELLAKAVDNGSAKTPPDTAEAKQPNAEQPDVTKNGDRTKTIEDSAGTNPEGTKAFSVEETPQGVRLSVKDLRFEADTANILPGETWRLDAIAKTLLLVNDGHYLVEGHTASVGKASGEKELSIKRAKKVVDELVSRGLHAEQFIYTGYGGTRPIADNTTEEGKALNRRVEITIME